MILKSCKAQTLHLFPALCSSLPTAQPCFLFFLVWRKLKLIFLALLQFSNVGIDATAVCHFILQNNDDEDAL